MLIADTNEFHPLLNAVAYRDAKEPDGTTHSVIILRATYSTTHVDNAYATSVIRARAAGLHIGHYGYMTAAADAAAQGRCFAQTVAAHGGLRPGDTIWCDDEEGAGNQAPRALAWLTAAHGVLKDELADEGVYSGAQFWQAHLGALPSGPHRWIAAYGQADPKVAGENLWQFTDNRVMAGVSGPCDASIYAGTLSSYLAMVGAATGPYRHVVPAGYGHSIDWLARSRNTTVNALVTLSTQHVNIEHRAVLAGYMTLRAALKAVGAPPPALPEGLVWYSHNP